MITVLTDITPPKQSSDPFRVHPTLKLGYLGPGDDDRFRRQKEREKNDPEKRAARLQRQKDYRMRSKNQGKDLRGH